MSGSLYFSAFDLRDADDLERAFEHFLDDLEAGHFFSPRPAGEQWYELLSELLPHALNEPYDTGVGSAEVAYNGWPILLAALAHYRARLPLPAGAATPAAAIAEDLHYRFELQGCLDWLKGVGRDGLSLKEPNERGRVSALLDDLRERPALCAYFHLSLNRLLQKLCMPPEEAEQLAALIKEELRLASPDDELSAYLFAS